MKWGNNIIQTLMIKWKQKRMNINLYRNREIKREIEVERENLSKTSPVKTDKLINK